MKEKIKKYIKEIVYFVITMTIVANIISFYKSTDLNDEPLHIKNVILLDKKSYTLSEDKPLLIHFWATWCPTCKFEASNIQTLSENFEVISIAVRSGTDNEIKEYLKKNGYTFNVVNDDNAFLARDFNISAYPTTFIYDKNKKVIFSEVGYTSTLGLWLRMLWAGL